MDLFGCKSLPFLTRRNYYYEMWHMLSWSVLAGLVEGHFCSVVVSKTFNGSDWLISIATSTPIAAMVFSLFWGALCVGRPKIYMFSMLCWGIVLTSAMVAAVPQSEMGAVWFIAQMAAAQILLAGVTTVRSAVWKSNYPHLERGRITAKLQTVREIVMVGSSMGAAALCDVDSRAYMFVFPLAALAGVLGIHAIKKLHVRGERNELIRLQAAKLASQQAGESHAGSIAPMHILKNAWRILKRDTRFTRYIIAQLCVGISNQMTLAVVTMIVTTQLAFDNDVETPVGYWISMALIAGLPKLFLLGTLRRWGGLFDKLGVVRFRVVNLFCWIGSLIFGLMATLAVVYRDEVGGMYLLWAVILLALRGMCMGLGMGGGRLAWNIGHLHFSKSEEAELYMGIHVSLTGMRGLVAPVGGMALWLWIGWPFWIVSLAFSFVSLAMFYRLAREELNGQSTSTAS